MEVYRYFWTKVTDRPGRVESFRAAMEVMERLEREHSQTEPDGRLAWKNLLAQARQYLGPGIEQVVKIVVARPKAAVDLEVVHDRHTGMSTGDIEISIATMPAAFTREDALAWLSNPVGGAWALGARSCRLAHAAVTNASAYGDTAIEMPPLDSERFAARPVDDSDPTSFISGPCRFYDVFSPGECDRIVEIGRGGESVVAGLVHPIENYRVGGSWHIERSDDSQWVFERLERTFIAANRWYRFDITRIREPLLYCEYPAGGVFGWHADSGEEAGARRKISASVQLSEERDYNGGGLEFVVQGEIADGRGKGTVIAFPAFLPHRVDRVASGVRRALVAWIDGPPFR
jgi:PKHD-type hydroxylase